MRTLIRNGTLYDGTGSPPQRADILIEAGKIKKIGAKLTAEGAEVLDAKNMAVTPGFIDAHRHCDIAALTGEDFGRLELAQGITSTVVGNCGLAPVPSSAATREAMYRYIEPVTGPIPGNMAYDTYAAYAKAVSDASPRMNMGFLAGLGAVRTAVKGMDRAAFRPDELAAGRDLVEAAMDAGAFGASTGMLYQPDCYTTLNEFSTLLAPVVDRDGLLCIHMRDEGTGLVEAVDEAIGIAARTGVRLNISHFKSTGKWNWRRKIYAAIDHIERAQELDLHITVDFYPYDAGATTLLTALPLSIVEDDSAFLYKKLATKAGKEAVRKALAEEYKDAGGMALGIGWNRIVITSTLLPEHAAWQGKDIASLAAEQGYEEPSDFVCDLLASEEGRVGIILMSMNQQDVDEIARLPYAAVISDALYGGGGNPHPRLYGAFPKIIRDYVRERGILTMEAAIHKMTGMPAERLRLKGRGILSPGNHADICVFDPKVFADTATFDDSKRLATGMHAVYVGGQLACRDGAVTPARAGGLLVPQE